MGHRQQGHRSLGRLNSRDARGGQYVALIQGVGRDRLGGGGKHADPAPREGASLTDFTGPDVAGKGRSRWSAAPELVEVVHRVMLGHRPAIDGRPVDSLSNLS